MTSNVQINTTPTQLDLNQIERWFIEEYNEFDNEFYSNWHLIKKAFENKQLASLEYLNYPIGFVTFKEINEGDIYIKEDYFVIERKYRGKGIGEIFVEKIADFYLQKGALAIIGHSENNSLEFWEKTGFIRYDTGYNNTRLDIYKPLINIASPTKNSNSKNRLELWDVGSHLKDRFEPKWVWDIETINNKLQLPIVHPCSDKWNLRWVKNDLVLWDDSIKYFDKNYLKCYETPFLHIDEIIE